MSFAELLYELPTERLKEIVAKRAATLRAVPRIGDKRELARFLASALSNPRSVAAALEATSLPEVRTLIGMVARGGDVPFDELVAAVGESNRGRLEDVVEALESRGLAIRRRREGVWGVHVPKGVRENTPVPAPVRYRLQEWLPRQHTSAIYRIGDNLRVPENSADEPSSAANGIIRELTTPGRASDVLASLSDEAKQIMELLLDHGGALSLYDLAPHLDVRKRNQLMTSGWTTSWYVSKPRNGVEELLGHGLSIVEMSGGWGSWIVVVPGDIVEPLLGRALIKEMLPESPVRDTIPASEAAVQIHGGLVRDVTYLMGFVARTEAACTAVGNMHRNAIKALARGLTITEANYAAFVYSLSRDCGLIAPQGRKKLYDITPYGERWLDEPRDIQVKALYESWRKRPSWDERFVDPFWDGKTYRSVADVEEVREPVISLICESARERPDELVSIRWLADLAKYRWWARFPYDRLGHRPDEEAEEGSVSGYDYVASNLNLLQHILGQSLYWLGLVEISSDSARVQYARVSPLGRNILLGEENDVDRVDSTLFVVQPNLEIYTPPGLPARDLYRLFRMSEPSASGMLAITKDSLRRAMDRGEQADELISFLRERSGSRLPQNVEYLIKQVGGRHGHIRIGQAGLFIQVDDPMLLKELESQNGLNIRFREQLAETVALISGDSVDSVIRQLRQAGYFPVSVERERQTAARRDATVDPAKSALVRPTNSETESRFDWAAIAASEELPWEGGSGSSSDRDVATDPKAIRALAKQAIREHRCMEILYLKHGAAGPTVRVIEPAEINSHLLRAYCRLREDERQFDLGNILEARFTGDRFDDR